MSRKEDSEILKAGFNDTTVMPWNIYDPHTQRGEHLKKFYWVHHTLKYKLITPVLAFVRKFWKKRLIHEVPYYPYNKNIKLFDSSFKQALIDWNKYFRGRFDTEPDYRLYMARRNDGSSENLRTMKDIIITVAMEDTSYREFLNILMYRIAQNMGAAYKDNKDFDHIFYSSFETCDMIYYALHQKDKREITKMIMNAEGRLVKLNKGGVLDEHKTVVGKKNTKKN
jgi:hypothetical protein